MEQSPYPALRDMLSRTDDEELQREVKFMHSVVVRYHKIKTERPDVIEELFRRKK